MKTNFLCLNALIVSFLLWTLTACYPTGNVRSGSIEAGNSQGSVLVAFSSADKEVIHSYYKEKRKDKSKKKKMPPGLAKKDKLPPGLQKQLQRNGKLPPGLQREHLPGDLERRLGALPSDYVRVRVGGDIVLMGRDTEVIFDILYDVD